MSLFMLYIYYSHFNIVWTFPAVCRHQYQLLLGKWIDRDLFQILATY